MIESHDNTFHDTDHSHEIDARVALLKEIPFFQFLETIKLTEIVRNLLAKTFPPSTKILTQNKPVEGIYFLQKGEVQVFVSNEETEQVELITHGYKGECFGEMSTLRGELNASATVLTTQECRFLYIDRNDFLQLVNEFNLWPQFVNVLASRLEQTNHRMTEVMKHLKQGMVQVDHNALITGKFSMGFVRLIGCEVNEIHGRSFPDMIFADSPEARKKWQENFSLTITSTPDQAALILNLLPNECIFKNPKTEKRILKITYDLCIYHKQVVGVDIGLEDVTRVRELDLKSRELEKEKNVIKEIYTKPETFRMLLRLLTIIQTDLDAAKKAIANNTVPKEKLRNWLGNLHSLKGTSYFIKLDEMGVASHQLENIFTRINNGEEPVINFYTEFLLKKTDLETQISYVDHILSGMSEETRKRLTAELVFSNDEAEALENLLKKSPQAMDLLLKAKMVSSQKLVEGWKDELERISQNLSKKIIFRTIGEPVSIPGRLFNILKVPMVHLLRNCAEHGIESIKERKKVGKPSVGLISFQAEKTAKQYNLYIQDNGKGISKNDIIAKAKEMIKRSSDLEPRIVRLLEEDRLLAILFLPGFSTTDKITDLSGRGVGLDVVQRAASEAGGKIVMKTVPGKGTKFTLSFPIT